MFRAPRLATAMATMVVGLTLAGTSVAQQADPGNSASAPGQQAQGTADPGNSAEAPGQLKQQDPPAEPQSQNETSGTGANQSGPYDPSGVGAPSGNGKSETNNGNRPCAGCVGNADAKNPPGQLPGGSDPNNGYECDGNQGVGKTNPAHSGCGSTTTTTPPSGGPPGGGPPGGGPPGGPPGVETTAPPPGAPPAEPGPPAPHQGIRGREEAGEEEPALNEVASPPREGPAAAPREAPVAGDLPFTGQDLLVVALLGVLSLAMGLGIARVVSPKRFRA